ncbi:hypothetical protein CTI14_53280, partial [Methylobacterium radiotolerans]
ASRFPGREDHHVARVGGVSRSTEEGADAESGASAEEIRTTAEESLVRKLRTRSLSVSEARLVLKGHGLATDASTT